MSYLHLYKYGKLHSKNIVLKSRLMHLQKKKQKQLFIIIIISFIFSFLRKDS